MEDKIEIEKENTERLVQVEGEKTEELGGGCQIFIGVNKSRVVNIPDFLITTF